MIYYIQYLIVRVFASILKFLPFAVAQWGGETAGRFIYFFMHKRRHIALKNIDKAFGDSISHARKCEIALGSFQNMCLSLIELFIVSRIKKNYSKHITMNGHDHFKHADIQDKGIILVVSHLGSWEYLSFLTCFTERPLSVVVKKIKNPYINDHVTHMRRITKVFPIDKMHASKFILKALKKRHGVAILIDQWSGADGLWLDFFGSKTSTTSIPARLAKKTAAVLVPAFCIRESVGKYQILVHPEVTFSKTDPYWEQNTTEKLNKILEEQIRKYPEQWLWGHRRWKPKPAWTRQP